MRPEKEKLTFGIASAACFGSAAAMAGSSLHMPWTIALAFGGLIFAGCVLGLKSHSD